MNSYNLLQAFSQGRVQTFKSFKPERGLCFTEGHWNVRRLNKDVEINFACNFRDRLYANMDELYSQVPQEEADPYGYGDETIYDSICYYRSPVSYMLLQEAEKLTGVCECLQQVGATDVDEKRTNILNELYETEKSYLTVLELISQDFYSSLVDHITSEDAELLFSAVKVDSEFSC